MGSVLVVWILKGQINLRINQSTNQLVNQSINQNFNIYRIFFSKAPSGIIHNGDQQGLKIFSPFPIRNLEKKILLGQKN